MKLDFRKKKNQFKYLLLTLLLDFYSSIAGPIIGGQIIQNAGYNWAFNIFSLLVYLGVSILNISPVFNFALN